MASQTLSRIYGPANIAADGAVFTGTAGHVYTIRHISLVNTTGAAITIALGVGGVAAANLFLPTATIDAGGLATFDGTMVISGTEAIHADISATGITITIAGLDQVT